MKNRIMSSSICSAPFPDMPLPKKITVVGFGKIGQALAASVLKSGLPVQAIDCNPGIKKSFECGTFRSQEPGVEKTLISAFRKRKLTVSARFSDAAGSQAVLVAIPLLVDSKKA